MTPRASVDSETTGTDNPKVARTICVNIERAATLARNGRLSNEKALKLIRETAAAIGETHGKLAADRAHEILKASLEEFVKIAGGEFTSYTIRSWLESWLASRTDASKATMIEYKHEVALFLKYMGARADRALTTLQPRQIDAFKEHLAPRVAPSTVNKAVKVLKAAFNNAVAKRQLEFSPAEHVEGVETEEPGRRPFTSEELNALLKAATGDKAEWRTMILVGFYTGMRLQDCASLTWRNIELHTSTINVVTEKTSRRQVLPIADPLARHLNTLAGDDPDAPLCPGLQGKNSSWLSAQFYNVMVAAGLAAERDHQTKGRGRAAKRVKRQTSFHSLRYNTTSALKNAGVNDSVAMDIVGHETAAVSRNYTKIDDAAKRAAISKLPDITQ